METLPSLQHDPNRPEVVLKVDCGFPINDIGISLRSGDGGGGDDAGDALRYLVATKSRAVVERKLRGV